MAESKVKDQCAWEVQWGLCWWWSWWSWTRWNNSKHEDYETWNLFVCFSFPVAFFSILNYSLLFLM